MLVIFLYLLLLMQAKAITFYFNIQLLGNLVSVNFDFSSGKRIITGRTLLFIFHCYWLCNISSYSYLFKKHQGYNNGHLEEDEKGPSLKLAREATMGMKCQRLFLSLSIW